MKVFLEEMSSPSPRPRWWRKEGMKEQHAFRLQLYEQRLISFLATLRGNLPQRSKSPFASPNSPDRYSLRLDRDEQRKELLEVSYERSGGPKEASQPIWRDLLQISIQDKVELEHTMYWMNRSLYALVEGIGVDLLGLPGTCRKPSSYSTWTKTYNLRYCPRFETNCNCWTACIPKHRPL